MWKHNVLSDMRDAERSKIMFLISGTERSWIYRRREVTLQVTNNIKMSCPDSELSGHLERANIARNTSQRKWNLSRVFFVLFFSELFSFKKMFFSNYLFIYLFLILLYNTVLVLPYIDMNPPWVYMSSQSWTPPATLPYHLSGSSQCTSPKHPVSGINLNLKKIID